MTNTHLELNECLNALPQEWQGELLPEIQRQLLESNTKIAILDDDPTGTQTIHNLPVLTTWDEQAFIDALKSDYPAFFVLTNSRSLDEQKACHLAAEIGFNLNAASKKTGTQFITISRSDSTLRGHFPKEVDAFAESMGDTGLPYLIIPFFFEGGRYTVDDTHYVHESGKLIPAAETIYAKDLSFGFQHSDLRNWVAEKTGERVPYEHVTSIGLSDIRTGGPRRVCDLLMSVPNKSACVVNAASYRDMEVFVLGLLEAEKLGKRFLYRTAASFVRVRTGVEPQKELLGKSELISSTSSGGLFIVGSHVTKTTSQLSILLDETDINPVEINVAKLLNKLERDAELNRVIEAVNQALQQSMDTVIFTSRELVGGRNAEDSLRISQRVSAGLIQIVEKLKYQPRYLVAKGGITSSDIATLGLKVKKALVLGQVLPGVPVWQLGEETKYPGKAYIIFPGNVGEDSALKTIKKKLE